MPTLLRRAFKIGAVALATIVVAAYLYAAFTYRSADVFAPPGRIESLGRTYLISNFPPRTRERMSEDESLGRRQVWDAMDCCLNDYFEVEGKEGLLGEHSKRA